VVDSRVLYLWPSGNPSIHLGVHYVTIPAAPWSFHFDNVTFDAK
jgi:hypothetical protein